MYHWELHLAPAATASPEELSAQGFSATFDSQAEAEQWLGENYLDLQDFDVEAVTLVEGERTVYGPMSLENG